jgi:hypothetical protein
MADYYKNSREYHDALDIFEARERARMEDEKAEAEADAKAKAKAEAERFPQCCFSEITCDNLNCSIHFPDGSDTSIAAQLHDAGFGSGGVM